MLKTEVINYNNENFKLCRCKTKTQNIRQEYVISVAAPKCFLFSVPLLDCWTRAVSMIVMLCRYCIPVSVVYYKIVLPDAFLLSVRSSDPEFWYFVSALFSLLSVAPRTRARTLETAGTGWLVLVWTLKVDVITSGVELFLWICNTRKEEKKMHNADL